MKVDVTKLKIISAEKGLNVQALADASGVSFTTIVNARSGKKVSERTIVKLAKALGINARDIMKE